MPINFIVFDISKKTIDVKTIKSSRINNSKNWESIDLKQFLS